jgi:riboflavin kinase/FMN adenylyltransferase
MKYIKNRLDFYVEETSVVTLGKFDGLHRGHELLIQEILHISKEQGCASIVFTFDIPPKAKVRDISCKILTTNEEKQHIFERTGVDYLIECPFTEDVMCMEPKEFITWISKRLHMKYVVVGDDFRFGHNRQGDYRTLCTYEEEFGYKTIVVDKIQDDGKDISSTYIRDEIAKGNIAKANQLLGYEYFIKNTVIHGNRIGRTIGIPTINMCFSETKLLPPNGVYVTRVTINDQTFMGVTNVGSKPTVSTTGQIGVETHILDFCEDVYGEQIAVSFLAFIRPEKKFHSILELQCQMEKDIAYTRSYYENVT